MICCTVLRLIGCTVSQFYTFVFCFSFIYIFCGIIQTFTLQKHFQIFFILDMLMILLPFSEMQRNAAIFFKNLILNTYLWFLLTKKKITIHNRFLMYWSKTLTKSFLRQLIENHHLLDNIHTGIHLDQKEEENESCWLFFSQHSQNLLS